MLELSQTLSSVYVELDNERSKTTEAGRVIAGLVERVEVLSRHIAADTPRYVLKMLIHMTPCMDNEDDCVHCFLLSAVIPHLLEMQVRS